jgi:hypothetical protein
VVGAEEKKSAVKPSTFPEDGQGDDASLSEGEIQEEGEGEESKVVRCPYPFESV